MNREKRYNVGSAPPAYLGLPLTPRDIRTADASEKMEADKEVEGKQRWDREFQYAFDHIIEVMTYGAAKYADRNWEKGLPWRKALGALMRHIRQFRAGETIDPESGLPHMAHAAWWCCALLDWMRTRSEFDDRNSVKPTLHIL